jgi:hypothetical protein
MKTLNFNKNSWHYRLVSYLRLYEAPYQKDIWGDGKLYTMGDSADICTYSKKVALALFLVSIGTAAFALISMLVFHTLLGIYFSVLMGQWFFSEIGNVGIILLSAGAAWAGLFLSLMKIEDIRKKNRDGYKSKSNKPDTFLSNAYKAWKNKFCVPINFNE